MKAFQQTSDIELHNCCGHRQHLKNKVGFRWTSISANWSDAHILSGLAWSAHMCACMNACVCLYVCVCVWERGRKGKRNCVCLAVSFSCKSICHIWLTDWKHVGEFVMRAEKTHSITKQHTEVSPQFHQIYGHTQPLWITKAPIFHSFSYLWTNSERICCWLSANKNTCVGCHFLTFLT